MKLLSVDEISVKVYYILLTNPIVFVITLHKMVLLQPFYTMFILNLPFYINYKEFKYSTLSIIYTLEPLIDN